MMTLTHTKRITVSAVCIALCCVLPTAFHSFGISSALSPMHFPVLLCGLVCGGWYGLLCGILGPVLSSLITSMPPAVKLLSMIPELGMYGLISGVLMQYIRTRSVYLDLYAAMIPAMLLGRIAAGIARVFIFMGNGSTYTWALWTGSYFISNFPAIVCQLIVVPALALILMKTKLIPNRYPCK